MITKSQIRNTLDNLCDNVTIEQLIFLDKVQKGLNDSENGRTNTVEEAKQKLNILL